MKFSKVDRSLARNLELVMRVGGVMEIPVTLVPGATSARVAAALLPLVPPEPVAVRAFPVAVEIAGLEPQPDSKNSLV